jgi:hypothetical protein
VILANVQRITDAAPEFPREIETQFANFGLVVPVGLTNPA